MTLVALAALSLFPAVSMYTKYGQIAGVLTFFAAFIASYNLYNQISRKLQPGYIGDFIAWVRTKPIYYPGKPKAYAPLIAKKGEAGAQKSGTRVEEAKGGEESRGIGPKVLGKTFGFLTGTKQSRG